jgi:hypothetical protein
MYIYLIQMESNMGDRLYHQPPVVGLALSNVDALTTTDNHGNKWHGDTLYCASTGQAHRLAPGEGTQMVMEIGPSDRRDFKPDGVTEIVSGLSPLQRHCDSYNRSRLDGRR